jgi:hypothetical protein
LIRPVKTTTSKRSHPDLTGRLLFFNYFLILPSAAFLCFIDKSTAMTIKKSTNEKRAIKQVKRKNAAAADVVKPAPKKEFNDDKNNTLEGYDENEYDGKDKADEKRRKA